MFTYKYKYFLLWKAQIQILEKEVFKYLQNTNVIDPMFSPLICLMIDVILK